MRELRQEARHKDISVNTLVSQILKYHAEWHSNAAKAGFIVVRRSFLNKLMDLLSEEDISSVSKEVASKETKDFVLLLRNTYDINSALAAVESWIRISGFPFRHESTDMMHSYVINHELGRKMSLALAEVYRHLFNEFGVRSAAFDQTDNTLAVIFDTSVE